LPRPKVQFGVGTLTVKGATATIDDKSLEARLTGMNEKFEDKFNVLATGMDHLAHAINVLTAQTTQQPITTLPPKQVLAAKSQVEPSHQGSTLTTPVRHRTLSFLQAPTTNSKVLFEKQPSAITPYSDVSSGLRLAFAIVPTATVLGPDSNGELALAEQHFVGSGYSDLLLRGSVTPQLGRAITQCGLLMDEEPYEPNISFHEDIQKRAEEKILRPLLSSLTRTAAGNPQLHNLTLDMERLKECITCTAAHPIDWPKDWNILLDTPDYLCIVRIHVGFDDKYEQLPNRRDTRLMLILLAENVFTLMTERGMARQNVLQTTNARLIYVTLDSHQIFTCGYGGASHRDTEKVGFT